MIILAAVVLFCFLLWFFRDALAIVAVLLLITLILTQPAHVVSVLTDTLHGLTTVAAMIAHKT